MRLRPPGTLRYSGRNVPAAMRSGTLGSACEGVAGTVKRAIMARTTPACTTRRFTGSFFPRVVCEW
jgi:hypothetical protein